MSNFTDLIGLADIAGKPEREWRYLGRGHYGLVDGDGRILAEITETWTRDVWVARGQKYHGKEAAMAAVEATL